jgi:hypothetical protein
VIYKFGVGNLDDASNILAVHQSAYSKFGDIRNKIFKQARPNFLAPTGYNPPIAIQTNFDESEPSVTTIAASTSGTQWDEAQWDTFQWAGGSEPSLGWQGVIGEGMAASVAFGVSSSEELIYNGTDVGFETGDYL